MINRQLHIFSGIASLWLAISITSCKPHREEPSYFGVAINGYPITSERLAEVKGELGRPPDLVLFYLQWPKSPSDLDYPFDSLTAVRAQGALPVITWEPMFIDANREHTIPAEDILSGRYDEYLRHFGDCARQQGEPVVVRLMHEMNLKRYHWGQSAEAYGPASPSLYRRLFRYIVTKVRSNGPTPILWAFSPNAESLPGPLTTRTDAWNTISAFYPGDDVVDVLGVDGYNWGDSATLDTDGWNSSWRSFEQIFAAPLQELRSLHPTKPIFIFELASVGDATQKRVWFQGAVARKTELPKVHAFVWFQENKERMWKISAASLPSMGERRFGSSPAMALHKILLPKPSSP